MTLPGFFFEITPTFYQFGMGFYQATPKIMTSFRESIDRNPETFINAISPIITPKYSVLKEKIIRDLKNYMKLKR